jgi:hypothetical protein
MTQIRKKAFTGLLTTPASEASNWTLHQKEDSTGLADW